MADFEDDEEEPLAQADYAAALQRLGSMSREDLLEYANQQLLLTLVARVELGMASHQEMAVLRGVLNDNRLVLPPLSSERPMLQDTSRPRKDVMLIPTYKDEDDE